MATGFGIGFLDRPRFEPVPAGSAGIVSRWKSDWIDPALNYIEGSRLVKHKVQVSSIDVLLLGGRPKTDSHLNEAR